jgi:hypothetical protein
MIQPITGATFGADEKRSGLGRSRHRRLVERRRVPREILYHRYHLLVVPVADQNCRLVKLSHYSLHPFTKE